VAGPLIGTSDSGPDATGRFIPFQSLTANWPVGLGGPIVDGPVVVEITADREKSLNSPAEFHSFRLRPLQWPPLGFLWSALIDTQIHFPN